MLCVRQQGWPGGAMRRTRVRGVPLAGEALGFGELVGVTAKIGEGGMGEVCQATDFASF